MSYDIKLIDEFRIESNNEHIEIPYKKLSLIIAYLIVEGKSNRDYLSELFWESHDNKTAKKNLRNAVYNIKKILGSEFIICHGRTFIEVNRSLINSVDYEKIIQLECSEYIDHFGIFLKGYLTNDSFNLEKWISKVNDDLQKKYFYNADIVIKEYLENREFDNALYVISKVLKYKLYDEELHRLAMRIYQDQKKYTEAINLYQNLLVRLDVDFGIKPEKRTRVLFEEISMKRANEENSKVNIYSFVNNDEVNRIITDSIKESEIFGKSRAIYLYGEAGVGKNNLIDYSLSKNIRNEYKIFQIKCNIDESDFYYNSVYYLLKKLDDVNINETLTNLFDKSINSATKESFNFNAPVYSIISDLLVDYFNNNKSIIIVNDLCNMDTKSKQIFNEVYEKTNVVVIITSRKEFCSSSNLVPCNDLCKISEKIHVKPWNREQVKLFLIENNAESSDEEIDHIFAISQGNRLFIEGIVNNNLKVVSSHSQIIEKGILNINNKSRTLLDLISVYHHSVSFEELLSIYSDSELDLVELLEYLIEINLLSVEETVAGNRYNFKHTILKEYIYSKIDNMKRAQYHYIIAKNIEKKIGESSNLQKISTMSYHFNKSNNKVESIKYSLYYLLLICSASLEIFTTSEDEISSTKEIEIELLNIKNRMKEVIVSDSQDYNIIYEYLYTIELYIKVSSFKTRNVVELINKLKNINNKTRNTNSLENIYLLQLFYAQNISDAKLFREALDNIKSFSIYNSLSIRMEAYYLYLTDDSALAINNLEKYLSNLNEKDYYAKSNFSVLIYLANFLIATDNYKRALSKLNDAIKIDKKYSVNNNGMAILYSYLTICYYELNNNSKLGEIANKTANLLTISNVAWKKALIYSYLYLIFKNDEKYYKLTKKYLRKSIPTAELARISKNLEL